tara:strand:- start:1407 stop:2597 length:1191 start_codon:yes stop_codon:yes gene_type:complete
LSSDNFTNNNLSKSSDSDKNAGFVVSEDFERFNQLNDMFTRAFWDDTVRSPDTDAFFDGHRSQPLPRKSIGFRQKDFALRNASWSVSDTFSNRASSKGKREGFQSLMENETPIAETKLSIEDKYEFTSELKKVGKLFGANLIGITTIDERWHYSHRVDTRDFTAAENDLPSNYSHVIVMGHSMKKELVDMYPAAVAGAATGLEYSREAAIVTQMTSYIRSLGYNAIGSMNDTALAIPYAIKAGLGEYARNQLVITREFGPRVRFSKIFTDLPLNIDSPVKYGISDYCNVCTKCSDACPPKALPYGAPSLKTLNRSTIKGVKKWSADAEKCFGYWAKIKTDCAICMRVCPFNREFSGFKAKLFWKLATGRFRKIALWWENKMGIAKQVKPDGWWKSA